MLPDREVAIRLATNREVDRKLRELSRSKYFWLYSLSLWNPDAFQRCVLGASCFAAIGLFLSLILTGGLEPMVATVSFEFFLLGLVLMWPFALGPWLQPRNLVVIFTFVFTLYRKNRAVSDLSAEEIRYLFPRSPSDARGRDPLARFRVALRQSPVIASLALGCCLAVLIVGLLLLTP